MLQNVEYFLILTRQESHSQHSKTSADVAKMLNTSSSSQGRNLIRSIQVRAVKGVPY
jgi:hypothetical protein